MVKLSLFKNEILKLYNANNVTDKSEVDWLFCHILNINLSGLITTDNIKNKHARKIKRFAKKRIKGKPLAKIIKNCNFYGLDFKVSKNVLTPRQETELLCEAVIKDYKETNNKKILDLCTGSGAIATVLDKKLKANITASDISKKALKIARQNVKKHNASISVVKSDLFESINGKFNAIVSNPPYIKKDAIKTLQVEVKDYDPSLALDGGDSGLEFYEIIIKNSPQKLLKNGKLYLELGKGQHKQVKKLMEKDFNNINIIKDYNDIERVIVGTKR